MEGTHLVLVTKRDDGEPDLYVHQRDVKRSGFRSQC